MRVDDLESRLLLQLLSASTVRAEVIANNLANQNTPGFKRQYVDFEDVLAAELERKDGRPDRVQPEVLTDERTPGRPDGNNVSMELEMNALNKNRLLYETYAAILTTKMELVRASIEER